MLRFLWPLLLMFGPQLAPRVIKFVRAVWLLHKDSRVNILLKLLIPLALVYAISPIDLIRDRIPFGLGRYDDIIIFGWRSSYSGSCVRRRWCASTWEIRRRPVPKTGTRTAWLTAKPGPKTTPTKGTGAVVDRSR